MRANERKAGKLVVHAQPAARPDAAGRYCSGHNLKWRSQRYDDDGGG